VTPASRAPRVQVVRYRTVRPYHGVFVYGPRPTRHDHYHGAPPARGHRVETSDLPTRTIDRDDSFALGLRMGSLISGYDDAAGYADLGFGGTMRFRPDEAVGLELAVSHYNQTFSDASERGQTLTSGSVELFAFPWSRVSPYVIGGVTWASGGFDDEVFVDGQTEQISMRRSAFGPHAGLGLEFALGQDVALDLEARYVGFLGHDAQDPTLPGGLTTTAGVLFHF
jgi:opacity protein-like surface antigen